MRRNNTFWFGAYFLPRYADHLSYNALVICRNTFVRETIHDSGISKRQKTRQLYWTSIEGSRLRNYEATCFSRGNIIVDSV